MEQQPSEGLVAKIVAGLAVVGAAYVQWRMRVAAKREASKPDIETTYIAANQAITTSYIKQNQELYDKLEEALTRERDWMERSIGCESREKMLHKRIVELEKRIEKLERQSNKEE